MIVPTGHPLDRVMSAEEPTTTTDVVHHLHANEDQAATAPPTVLDRVEATTPRRTHAESRPHAMIRPAVDPAVAPDPDANPHGHP